MLITNRSATIYRGTVYRGIFDTVRFTVHVVEFTVRRRYIPDFAVFRNQCPILVSKLRNQLKSKTKMAAAVKHGHPSMFKPVILKHFHPRLVERDDKVSEIKSQFLVCKTITKKLHIILLTQRTWSLIIDIVSFSSQ